MLRVAVVFYLAAYISCMEMRETVERMVMVRTTGSDLQPAATGFIYKKDSDGPVSVVKMDESEVMEHLSKAYETPNSYAAPIPVAIGPFHSQEEDKKKVLSSESKVVPVTENQDDTLDGIANEDYEKILDYGKYASDYLNYESDFNDYLKSLGYFEDDPYFAVKQGDKSDYRIYHEPPYDSKKQDEYHYGRKYKQASNYNDGDPNSKATYAKVQAVYEIPRLFNNKNEFYKDHSHYDKNFENDEYYGHHTPSRTDKLGTLDNSELKEDSFNKNKFYVKVSDERHNPSFFDDAARSVLHRNFGVKSGALEDGTSYDYQIKH